MDKWTDLGKLKVYELAKEMNLTNQEMIEKLKNIGVEVKSHLSTVEENVVEKLKGGANKKTEKAPKEEKKTDDKDNKKTDDEKTDEEKKDDE